ncbi:histidine kinase [Ulvibacterium sp.]|uniref:sensor histidine kinase n=1 Tax=Ulvibacterium sp. TaxID=2665914 RepID=UPI003BAAA1F1
MNGPIKYSIFAYLFIFNVLNAQDYTIRDVEINPNGESHKYRNLMQVDEDGFLWYSTYNGLVKDFGTYNVLSALTGGNADNVPKYIYAFFIDSGQRIWISTTMGIFVSNKGLDASSNHLGFKLLVKGSELQANSFIEDCDGTLWITAGASDDNILLEVSPSLKVTKHQVQGMGPRHDASAYFLRGHLQFERRIGCGKFLVRQGRKLFVQDKDKTVLIKDLSATQNYRHTGYYHPEWQYNGGDGLLITDNGDILSKSLETQYTYEGEAFGIHFIKDLNVQVISLPIQEMIPITKDNYPTLKNHADFIGIDNPGKDLLFFKMVKMNRGLHLKVTNRIPFPNLIDDVVINKNGIIYVTSDDRISKIKFSKNYFDRFLDYGENRKIDVRGFLELPTKEILTATNEGVFKLTPSDGTYIETPFEKEIISSDNVSSLKLRYMKSFVRTSDSTAWCLGESKWLFKINFVKNTVEEMHVFQSHRRRPSLHYYDILESSDSTLLLASHYGLHEFNTKQKEFRELPIPQVVNNEELFIWNLHSTKERLFIGTDAQGLFIQDLNSDTLIHLNKDSTKSGLSLPSNKIHSIFTDEQDNIWLGTNKGAVQIDKDLQKITVIDGSDGLTNLNVVGILEDTHKNMWFSTHNGLYRYGKDQKKITAFYVEEGLTSNDFNQISSYRSSTGKLFFGGVNGLIAFDSIADTAQNKDIRIFPTQFGYYDTDEKEEVELDVITGDSYSFSLPYSKNSFSVTYSINDCYNTETNKYAYKLDGFMDDWVDLGNQTTLKLLSIPPGDYALRIKGFNPAGLESSNELIYDIHVAQIFYKRPWVQRVAALILFGIVILGMVGYTSRERKKFRLHLAMMELERRALRTQMNPHFLFNMLNRIGRKVKNAKLFELEKYVATFSGLMRLTLDMTRNDKILLSKEIQYIKNYVALTNTESGNEIVLTIQSGPDIDMEGTFIPSMILQPIVENSIVHGFVDDQKEKSIIIKIEKSATTKQFVLTVEDNGMGISKTKKNNKPYRDHQSHATQILRERLKLLNQIRKREFGYEVILKDIGDGVKTGTRVTIRIPY